MSEEGGGVNDIAFLVWSGIKATVIGWVVAWHAWRLDRIKAASDRHAATLRSLGHLSQREGQKVDRIMTRRGWDR